MVNFEGFLDNLVARAGEYGPLSLLSDGMKRRVLRAAIIKMAREIQERAAAGKVTYIKGLGVFSAHTDAERMKAYYSFVTLDREEVIVPSRKRVVITWARSFEREWYAASGVYPCGGWVE